MGIGDKIGNGNGKEWETTCMGMGMAIIPMGINSQRRIQRTLARTRQTACCFCIAICRLESSASDDNFD